MIRNLWHRTQGAAFALRICLAAPFLPAYWTSSQKDVMRADLDRWMLIASGENWAWKPHTRASLVQLLYLLTHSRAFRSLFYYRSAQSGPAGRIAARLLGAVYRGETALQLNADHIGPGLYIVHGFSTIVTWKAVIGANCRIYHNVTIGWNQSDDAPRIGNDVTVYTGAVVIGAVTIGDGAIVAANAVVTKNVPSGTVARGVPATMHPRGAE